MLHRVKLLKALEDASQDLFFDNQQEKELAQRLWQSVANDETLAQKIKDTPASWQLPLWQGCLEQSVKIEEYTGPYHLLAVDGSQIYPDRHQGTSCFLINIGTVQLFYKMPEKTIEFASYPTVFTEQSFQDISLSVNSSVDMVNGKREELELQEGFERSYQFVQESDKPFLFLFDGSLIFWHLASKEQDIKDYFLRSYFSLLEQFHTHALPLAGYISLPKSKDLVNVLRTVSAGFSDPQLQRALMPHSTDAFLMSFFLQEGHRSTVFQSQSAITEYYPQALKPYFFYYNTGDEIVRIELPAYLAQDETMVNHIISLIQDQVKKGAGFPVGLAEAHEQAVVKGPDRDFFYHLIEKMGVTYKRRIVTSQKSQKKRSIAI